MFLKDTYFEQHILSNNILYQTKYLFEKPIFLYNVYGLYDIYIQQYKYVYQQHIYVIRFYKTYVYCIIEQHICDP